MTPQALSLKPIMFKCMILLYYCLYYYFYYYYHYYYHYYYPLDNAIHPLKNDWGLVSVKILADLFRNQKLCSYSKEFLTPEKCAHHIILRGLVRVLMVAEVRRVLFFLGKKGTVNHGILPDVPKTLPSTQYSKVLNL